MTLRMPEKLSQQLLLYIVVLDDGERLRMLSIENQRMPVTDECLQLVRRYLDTIHCGQ
jgi:hypothetical protein